jgi:hypothetical protein
MEGAAVLSEILPALDKNVTKKISTICTSHKGKIYTLSIRREP